MSDKTINFILKVEGALTDATSVKLSDPTATFGARRQDTGDIIVADGADLTHDSTGVYSYAFTGLVSGKVYEYWVEWTYGGVTNRDEREFTAGVNEASGDYTNQAALVAFQSQDNIDIEADIVGSEQPADIEAGVQSGIDLAESEINLRILQRGLTVPWLEATDATLWAELQSIATILAYVKIHAKRSQRENPDENAPVFGAYGKAQGLWKEGIARLERWLNVAGALYGTTPTAVPAGTMVSVPLNWRRTRSTCDENGCG